MSFSSGAVSFLAASILSVTSAFALPVSPADVTHPALPDTSQMEGNPGMPLEFFNFMKECVQITSNENEKQLAAWLPMATCFKLVDIAGGKTGSLEASMQKCQPYLMFIVENRVGSNGSHMSFEPVASMRARAVLKFTDGQEVRALEKVPEDFPSAILSLARLPGTHQANLLIFPAGTHADLDLSTAKNKLSLSLLATKDYHASDFVWRLPLEIYGSTQQCTKCHSDLSAKWSFCPYCGTPARQR